MRTSKKRFKTYKSIALPKGHKNRYYGIRKVIYGRRIIYVRHKVKRTTNKKRNN